PQPPVAICTIGRHVFQRVIRSQFPARHPTTRPPGRLLVAEIKKFFVLPRVPMKGVGPIGAEDVVDPENGKKLRQTGDALFTPGKTVGLHVVPSVERNPPVLSPLLEKWIALAHSFWRRAAKPVEVKFVAIEKDIRGVPTHADRDVAHQLYSSGRRMLTDRTPLAEAQPLDESVVAETDSHCGLIP